MISLNPMPGPNQSSRIPASKMRLLIVSDSSDRLARLRALLSASEIEIVGKTSLEELDDLSHGEYDLAVVDVGPPGLVEVLKALRTTAKSNEISVLVEASRLPAAPGFAGVLPKYRAMPCSSADLVTLVRCQITATSGRQKRRML